LTLAEYKVSINMKDRQIEKRFQNFFELWQNTKSNITNFSTL
jgi:hypothetical protein